MLIAEIVEAKNKCLDLRVKFMPHIGDKQKLLLSKLESINVYTQAYHSPSFVGNHCKIILKLHYILTDVLTSEGDSRSMIKYLVCLTT